MILQREFFFFFFFGVLEEIEEHERVHTQLNKKLYLTTHTAGAVLHI